MSTFFQDLRYGLRMLAKNPGFTAVAVVTLALGIGANTTIFSLIDAVMLRTLPVKNPEQLVLLSWVSQQTLAGEEWLHGDLRLDPSGRLTSRSFSYPAFEEFQRTNHVFSSLFGFNSLASANISAAGQANYAEEELVSGDYFSALGIQPILGRFITPGDESAEAPSVAVISYGLWSRQFGRSPAALGKSLAINGVPCTVVGVAPPQFFGVTPGRAVDVWVPLVQNPKLLPWGTFHFPGLDPSFDSPTHWWVEIIGRLKPGLTAEQAPAQLELLFHRCLVLSETGSSRAWSPDTSTRRSRDGFNAGAKPQTIPHLQLDHAGSGLAVLRRQFSTPLRILTVVVAIVLLIACANVAALLLARSAVRQPEITLRLSLGASRARLARQLLTESVLLAGLGGMAGVLFARWATPALVLLMSPDNQSLNLSVQLQAKVLGFTAAVSILTGILFGLAPALRLTLQDMTPALKASGRRIGIRQAEAQGTCEITRCNSGCTRAIAVDRRGPVCPHA
jgi:predicted permease